LFNNLNDNLALQRITLTMSVQSFATVYIAECTRYGKLIQIYIYLDIIATSETPIILLTGLPVASYNNACNYPPKDGGAALNINVNSSGELLAVFGATSGRYTIKHTYIAD
jgi:hypothetical protein